MLATAGQGPRSGMPASASASASTFGTGPHGTRAPVPDRTNDPNLICRALPDGALRELLHDHAIMFTTAADHFQARCASGGESVKGRHRFGRQTTGR